MPVFGFFLIDNASEVFEGIVTDKHGKEYCTTFELLLKRRIDLFYTQVNKANHLFPVPGGEEEKIIYDEFLQEQFDRRSE